MDPRGVGTISIELNRTAAELLANLCVRMGTDDAVGVVSRALGVMDMIDRSKKKGARLVLVNALGEQSDVVV